MVIFCWTFCQIRFFDCEVKIYVVLLYARIKDTLLNNLIFKQVLGFWFEELRHWAVVYIEETWNLSSVWFPLRWK